MRATTMATPTSAVALRRNRRSPWASGDSERSTLAGQATPVTPGSSASRVLPPLMGRGLIPSDSPLSAMLTSGVADPRIQERVREIDDQVDHDEGERRDQEIGRASCRERV